MPETYEYKKSSGECYHRKLLPNGKFSSWWLCNKQIPNYVAPVEYSESTGQGSNLLLIALLVAGYLLLTRK